MVYHSGVFDETTLRRFQEGLLKADKTALGRQLLTLWSLTGFEKVPENFERTLVEIGNAYPPVRFKKASRTTTNKTDDVEGNPASRR